MIFTASALTDVPIHVGGRMTVEGPARLRYSLSSGYLPPAYVGVINDVCVAAGWYSESTASLVQATVERSLVVRNHVGWRPWAGHGFQFELGYGWVGLGGGLTGTEVIAAATGTDVSSGVGDGREFSARASLHQLDVSAGWEWTIRRHVLLRADVGGAFTLASTTVIEPDFDVPRVAERFVDELTQAGEDYLDDTFTSYVHTPTLSFAAGWRF
jgi:hypothetical protein